MCVSAHAELLADLEALFEALLNMERNDSMAMATRAAMLIKYADLLAELKRRYETLYQRPAGS